MAAVFGLREGPGDIVRLSRVVPYKSHRKKNRATKGRNILRQPEMLFSYDTAHTHNRNKGLYAKERNILGTCVPPEERERIEGGGEKPQPMNEYYTCIKEMWGEIQRQSKGLEGKGE